MIPPGFFITGTDTEVGKTTIAASILYLLGQKGLRTVGLKPVASGGNDAGILKNYANTMYLKTEINPFLFKEAIAPHLAAQHENQLLSVQHILTAYKKISFQDVDIAIVEGAGGWLTPLNHSETLADLAQKMNYPIILIVGMRLGCVNHTLLTIESIQAKNLTLKGWIANCIEPNMLYLEENIQSLEKRIAAPLLGVVPYQKKIDINTIAHLIKIPIS